MGIMDLACILCDNPHVVNLGCKHNMCLQCILKLYDGIESTPCPFCKQVIDMTPILKLTLCARCKSLQNNYCSKCSNFLCDTCWSLIHSFPPANTHVKSVFNINIDERKHLFDQVYITNKSLKQIDRDLGNLEREYLKETSVKHSTLYKIHKIYDNYRKQLHKQQKDIEDYINEQTVLKKEQLLHDKVELKTYNELCCTKILNYDNQVSVPEIPAYVNRLDYNLVINSIVLPEIVSIPKDVSMVCDIDGVERWFSNDKLHRDGDLPAVIYPNGRKEWYENGRLHRDNDQPAWIESDGRMAWYNYGLLHRDNDQPALIQGSGSRHWYQDGLLHRVNGPAYICPSDGERWCLYGRYHRDIDEPAYIDKDKKMWYKNGKLHRETGPAIIYANGDQQWYIQGQAHRIDGPAKIYANGKEEWYFNGKLHRIDGPAIIMVNKREEYYINGVLHRDHDLPAVIRRHNTLKWYQNGRLHRNNDQPAVISDKKQMWYVNGLLHRDNDLPAIIHKDGRKEFYIKGHKYIPQCKNE